MYLIYKTDNMHSYASHDLIAITPNKRMILKLIKQQVKEEGEKLDSDQIYNLQNINQTQGYSGEGEFNVRKVEINKLL